MTATNPPALLGDAIDALRQRWTLSPREAAAAISEVAEELDLDVSDMAALVAAAEQQRRLLLRSWSLGTSVTTGWSIIRPAPHTAER